MAERYFKNSGRVYGAIDLRPSELYRSLCYALKHFKVEHIFIRLVGSQGGTVKVSEELQQQKLEFRRCRAGLRVIIDGKEVFLFKQTSFKKRNRLSGKQWSLAYHRIDKGGKIDFASTGYVNPDDSQLPEVKQSIFKAVNGDHFIEVTFTDKIPITCTHKLISGIKGWFYWRIKDLNP